MMPCWRARDRPVRSGERNGIFFYGLIMETVPAWAIMADVKNGCVELNTWRDF
jgi:hypothetical protein